MAHHPEVEIYAAARHSGPPDRLGLRYSAQAFLPEAGNTVVCHLDQSHPDHKAVLEARAEMMALPGAEHFLFTPASSLHMTVFEGVIETRRTPDAWPAGRDRTEPVDAVTEALVPRLRAFTPPPAFQVRVMDVRPSGLLLGGASAQDSAAMSAWREALTTPFGYRHAKHDAYRYHMTFAYPVRWLEADVLDVWSRAMGDLMATLVARAPVIPLRPPAFCAFADMTHFKELLVLAPAK